MTEYDWLLVFLGVGLVIFFAYQRMVRALFTLAALWSATLGSAALYPEAAFRVQAVASKNPTLVRGVMFNILFVIFLIVGYVLLHVAFPVTKLPKIGFLDNLMGLMLGTIIAIVVIAVILNSMGVMVMERWETNEQGWAALRQDYYGSQLRPYTSEALAAYSWAFYPFFVRIPPVLIPQ